MKLHEAETSRCCWCSSTRGAASRTVEAAAGRPVGAVGLLQQI